MDHPSSVDCLIPITSLPICTLLPRHRYSTSYSCPLDMNPIIPPLLFLACQVRQFSRKGLRWVTLKYAGCHGNELVGFVHHLACCSGRVSLAQLSPSLANHSNGPGAMTRLDDSNMRERASFPTFETLHFFIGAALHPRPARCHKNLQVANTY